MKNRASTAKRRKYRPNELSRGWNLALTIAFSLLAATAVLPVLLVIIISLSSSESLSAVGYSFFPTEWSLLAYETLLETGSSLWDSYLITIFYTAAGTALHLFVMSMYACILARKDFKHRNFFAFYVFVPTLFSGGLVPSYILNVKYLHLDDTIWIYLLPGMMGAFSTIILRTFMQSAVPDTLYDAVKIDGGSDWTMYWRIVMPLSKAGLATMAFGSAVGRWNDWFTGVLYIENPKLTPVMTYLQRIQRSIDFLKNNSDIAGTPDGMALLNSLPTESARMAITVLVILPLLVAYPFFQKYFIKGMVVGSVKG